MRGLIVAGVLGLVAGAIWLSLAHDELEKLKASQPPAGAPASHLTKNQVHDCRDACDQNAVLQQWPDDRLRACRADCDRKATPPRPYEPIRRITVAPADHHVEAPARPR